jgi:hypothetical protein
MAEHEDDELNRLRSIFAHAHAQPEVPSPKVIQRVVAQVRALLKKKTVADLIKPKKVVKAILRDVNERAD